MSQAQPPAAEIDYRFSDELRAQGFEAGTVVRVSQPSFIAEELVEAAVHTRYSHPKTLPIALHEIGIVQVAILALHLRYEVFEPGRTYRDNVYYEIPDFYFEGWIVEDGATHHVPHRLVRAFFHATAVGDGFFNEMKAQIIPRHPDANGQIGCVSD